MYQIRIYTLRTREALERYATVHWPRHVASMPTFGVTVRGFWTDHDADVHRLIVLLSLEENVDPAEFTNAYVASPDFAADMRGFDLEEIIGAEELLLDSVVGSPMG